MVLSPAAAEKYIRDTGSAWLVLAVSAWTLIFVGLIVVSRYNYLLFHSAAEIFSIVIAAGMFVLVWNTREDLDNNYLFFLGIAYLFIGIIDGLHILAYEGMGVFPGHGANLPTQLWIAARYFESLSLLFAPVFLGRSLNQGLCFVSLLLVAALVLSSIFFWDIFPDCYLPGSGLTLFKVFSEYLISGFLVLAGIGIWRRRSQFEQRVYLLVILSIVLTVAAELSFTAYLSVHGMANLIGHLLKILSFYFLYKAIIETGLRKPHDLLFLELNRKQERLQEVNRMLTEEIAERRKAENERVTLIAELQTALNELKVLRGILPICSFCKKIRDDEGYWSQVEVYISEHAEVDFSHGICPECVKKHYKDL